MPGGPFLRGERVTLRTIEEEDMDVALHAVNDPRVRRPLTSAHARNGRQQREHFEEHISDDETVDLAVCADGETLGMVHLFDLEDGHAEIAYWLAPEHHGEGYMTEAARLLVSFAFEERRCHRVRGRALATNPASQRVLEKAGMTREGVAREAEFVDGEYVDMVYFGVLEDEYRDARGAW